MRSSTILLTLLTFLLPAALAAPEPQQTFSPECKACEVAAGMKPCVDHGWVDNILLCMQPPCNHVFPEDPFAQCENLPKPTSTGTAKTTSTGTAKTTSTSTSTSTGTGTSTPRPTQTGTGGGNGTGNGNGNGTGNGGNDTTGGDEDDSGAMVTGARGGAVLALVVGLGALML